MGIVHNTILIVGLLGILTGVIWIGQGFMINQMLWAYAAGR